MRWISNVKVLLRANGSEFGEINLKIEAKIEVTKHVLLASEFIPHQLS